ncbi:MAG: hypothetical protein KAX40_06050 [Herpetosiphon sp.]|nr:hypothetical protein [Herpetosiphon sp.]
MNHDILITHERTLLGAIDSFQGTLVRTRPYLAAEYGEILENFAQAWLDGGYPNQLDSMTYSWIRAYLGANDHPALAKTVLQAFFDWTVTHTLIDHHPMEIDVII